MGNESILGLSTHDRATSVLENLLEGCQVIGFDYRYLYVNAAALEQTRRSREQLLGRTMTECFPGIDQTPMFAELRRVMVDRVHHRMENELAHSDGSVGWFELRFVPVPDGVCILSLEITEAKRSESALRRTEAQLRHAQKMEAVGRLAGGVSHDFNNLLSVILSYADLVLSDLREDDPMRADILEIRKAGLRASELTQQLQTLSRHRVVQARVLDVGQVVRNAERMLARVLGEDIDLTTVASPDLGRVLADPGSVEQVLMNLVVNARDAMPLGGKLTIEAKNVELGEDYAREHLDVQPGSYVMLAVSDTGVGMDKQTVARIFEPFFTTKEQDKGTGLGLSTVFGIVKQSGGHIWVYSEPGMGSTFKVYLPRVEGVADTQSARPSLPVVGRGTETVLLVEDDPQVRAVTRNILRRGGYRVLEAANGGEALLICEQHSANIHLLLTDVVLPKMSGPQLAERLVALRPRMKVLFTSGYAEEAVLRHGILESEAEFLQKPITAEVLGRKVREVLERESE